MDEGCVDGSSGLGSINALAYQGGVQMVGEGGEKLAGFVDVRLGDAHAPLKIVCHFTPAAGSTLRTQPSNML